MRKWIANKLVRLARHIYPESEEVTNFYMERMMEYVISGKSDILISRVDTSREPQNGSTK